VPSKPARIGLWFYELAIPLPYGAQYLLPTKLSFGEEGLPVATMARYRCDVIISSPDTQTMLLFDSYQMDKSSTVILEQSGVMYLASFNPFRFKTVEEDLEPKVTKEGNGLACMIRQAVIQSSTIGLHKKLTNNDWFWRRDDF
jgi:hypothetical protein